VTSESDSVEDIKRLDRLLVHGLAWTGSVRWGVQFVTWLSTIAVARLLMPSDFGVLSMASVYLNLIVLLSEFGIATTIVTLRRLTDEQIAQINGLAVLLGLTGLVLSCAVAFPLATFFRTPELAGVIVAMSVVLVLGGVRAVPGALLQRSLRFRRIALIDGTQSMLQAATTLTCAALGARYWSLVLGAVVASATGTILTLASQRHSYGVPRRSALGSALVFTRETLIARICWYLYLDADFIVAGRVLGREALGAYSFAWTLGNTPLEKIATLVTGITPAVLSAVQDDAAALRRYFSTLTQALALAVLPLTIGLALTARDVVALGLGDKWLAMVAPLQLIAAYAGVRALMPLVAQILSAKRDTRFVMRLNMVALAVMPLAFLAGSRWGTTGIAAAWIVVHPFVVTIPLLRRVFRTLDMSYRQYLGALRPSLTGCALMAAAVVLLNLVIADIPARWRLLIDVVGGGVAYGAALWLWHRSELARLRRAIATLKRG
jgi:O-antigen/teichoic acid export membrane protein